MTLVAPDAHAAAQVRQALERTLPVVLDGDGIYLVQRCPSMLADAGQDARVVLTPNVNEFRRLRDVLQLGTSGAQQPTPRAVFSR